MNKEIVETIVKHFSLKEFSKEFYSNFLHPKNAMKMTGRLMLIN